MRRLRDVAVDLSTATTRRAVAAVMLRATLEVAGGQVGAVALFRGRGRGSRRADLLATTPPRDARRVRALSAAADAIDGLLEPHAALELSSPEEVHRAIGDQPATVLGADSLSAYPIVWRSRVRGALIVAASTRQSMEEIDREFVDAVVVMGAPALERAGRYDIDHEIALKLQRGMMSMPPCDAPEISWSAHYSSAATGLVGGDWYDIIGLDERIGFAIGDIVGRGIDAAVAMGQVRSAGRALANCFDKPHEVVEGLDHFASSTRCGEDSSMAYLTINRHSGELAYAVAGHPPPLVLGPDGTVMWLDGASSALLGRGGKRPSAALHVEPGSTVVLVHRRTRRAPWRVTRRSAWPGSSTAASDAGRRGQRRAADRRASRPGKRNRRRRGGRGRSLPGSLNPLVAEQVRGTGDLDEPGDDARRRRHAQAPAGLGGGVTGCQQHAQTGGVDVRDVAEIEAHVAATVEVGQHGTELRHSSRDRSRR